ncbi:MAG: hypothetical protein RI907_3305 [Pseudomonadota bacterium]|jgi:protein-tyrosine phosphatase
MTIKTPGRLFCQALAVTVTLLTATACAAPKPAPDACRQPLSPQVENACVVKDGVLWRGAKPTTEGATALLNLGVKSIVNLELLHSDLSALREARPTPATAEPRLVGYYEVPEWEPNVKLARSVLDGHVAEFLAIVRSQPKPVYVHCRSGQNRTGVMVAAFRILEEGVPVEQAIEEMGKYRGVWFSADAAYLRELAGERRSRLMALIGQKQAALEAPKWLACGAQGCVERR